MTPHTSGAADLPEALRLADFLRGAFALDWTGEAAAELRRLHSENERLATLVAGRAVAPVEKWADRVQRAHPKSEPEFWPDELRVKYMAEEIRDLRAALAAGAGGKVYLVATGLTNEAGTVELYERHDKFVPLCDSECLYTTPQPTQVRAGAVPLTDERIKDLQDDGVFLGTCRQIVRAIEAAHGIKGGQHGTE